MTSARFLNRRTALIAGAGCLLAACGARPSPAVSGTAVPPPESVRPPEPAPLLADPPPYVLRAGEVEPACKAAAVAYVSTALTVGTASARTSPGQRLQQAGHDPSAASALAPLLPPSGASTVEVVYPQYGGLVTGRNACVMLVAEQSTVTAPGAPVARRTLTLDVRLVADRGAWRVIEVIPAVDPVPASALSASVLAVLADDRIVLPDAARADLRGGTISDAVAESLLAAADRWQVHVLVLTGGHPPNVWNTNRVSNHTGGRAVDIWALDDIPVIDGDRCPWQELARVGAASGAREIGTPYSVGVRGGFSDRVHQDHIHFGF